ncbi:unnamed protein product [Natator depressus]
MQIEDHPDHCPSEATELEDSSNLEKVAWRTEGISWGREGGSWPAPASSKQKSSDSEIKRISVREQSIPRLAATCWHMGGITGFHQDKLGRILPIGELLTAYEVAIICCPRERITLKGISYLGLHRRREPSQLGIVHKLYNCTLYAII